MDEVYVIYYDGNLYFDCGNRNAFLYKADAEEIIARDAKRIAMDEYGIEHGVGTLRLLTQPEETQNRYVGKCKARFEIKTFAERN